MSRILLNISTLCEDNYKEFATNKRQFMNNIPKKLSFTPCNLCQYHLYDKIKCYIKNIIVNLERCQTVAYLYSTLDPDLHFLDLIFHN